jgi:3-methyladenine DNA glycosylase AlkD
MRALASPEIAAHSRRFFKTGPGQYGAGDRFLGIRVPETRRLARANRAAGDREILDLLRSAYHEERLLALLMLVERFTRGDAARRNEIYALYIDNLRYVNNWDLVDSSASQIAGAYLEHRSRRPLYRLARSRNLWERRIAIIATLHFIRRGEFDDTLAIAERFLGDTEDLIHKAVGWMLREVGDRDSTVLERFLGAHHAEMPRTMLRYAIEKLPETRRKAYLVGSVGRRSGREAGADQRALIGLRTPANR